MEFRGAFRCSKCGFEFTIDLGPQWMAEKRSAKKIGADLGAIAVMFSRSCKAHESTCEGLRK